ncbi:CPCC family cysteine-rich protein [Amycolatopsis sp. NPDC049159]|uniref:CPCC family cysteine-rich protein n=1 Tax=Amycolatopsis sp. NPDC049159 TaxID=3157210 RepID=UPI0033FDA18B
MTLVAAEAGYPCPCRGHLVFGEPPGSYEICGVCFWEDDPVQLRCDRAQGGGVASRRPRRRRFRASRRRGTPLAQRLHDAVLVDRP